MKPLDEIIDENFVLRLSRGEPWAFEGQLEDVDGNVEPLAGRTFFACVMAADGTRLREAVAEIYTDSTGVFYRGVIDGSMSDDLFGQSNLLWWQGERTDAGNKPDAQGLLVIYPGPGMAAPVGPNGLATVATRFIRRASETGRARIRKAQAGARGPSPWDAEGETLEAYNARVARGAVDAAQKDVGDALLDFGQAFNQAQIEIDEALATAIRTDVPQTLASNRRRIARSNIGAPAVSDFTTIAPMDLATARYDMTSLKANDGVASEGLPHGAFIKGTSTYFDWAKNPLNLLGTAMPAGWTAGIPWVQVYQNADRPSTSTNTRVQVRNNQMWVKRGSTGEYLNLVMERDPIGAGYVENFETNEAIGLDQRREPGGGVSVRMVAGYSYHGYARQRVLMPVGDIAAIYTSFEARLVIDDPALPDDRDQAHYIASGGADYWASLSATNAVALGNNNAAMMGRLKRVTNEWRTFSACTLTPEQMTDLTVLPPLVPDSAHLTYGLQHSLLGKGDLWNGLDATLEGRALDARQGKVLGDTTKALADRMSAVEATTGGAASRDYFDGVPTIEPGISGKTFYIDASAPIALPLPATTTGAMRFSIVQMNAAGPIVFAPRVGAIVLGRKTQTNGLFSKYDVQLSRNYNGTSAEWMITGSSPLVDAQSAPVPLWTPYNYGLDRTDLWIGAGSPQTITNVGGKASRVLDKSSKGRSFSQANDTYRPALANLLNGRPGLVSSAAAPAVMAGVPGSALTTLTDLFFNGGAFLTATATLSETYSNVPYNAARIAIFRFSPAGGDVWVNGTRLGGFPDSRVYGFTGMAWLVFNPLSAGQNALGRFYHAGSLGLLGTVPTSGNPARCADATLWDFGVVNLPAIFLTGSGDSNVDLLNGYLAALYGLRELLPASQPYKAVAPTL